mmetsp:Transcript_117346/g.278659  ORF Transcript_117346/g.278659 Transcript_117346/m.278659 type:complete len:202 (-) Transcript_117346:238-843(-)
MTIQRSQLRELPQRLPELPHALQLVTGVQAEIQALQHLQAPQRGVEATEAAQLAAPAEPQLQVPQAAELAQAAQRRAAADFGDAAIGVEAAPAQVQAQAPQRHGDEVRQQLQQEALGVLKDMRQARKPQVLLQGVAGNGGQKWGDRKLPVQHLNQGSARKEAPQVLVQRFFRRQFLGGAQLAEGGQHQTPSTGGLAPGEVH